MFSRSNTARCRSGDRTARRPRSSRDRPVAPGRSASVLPARRGQADPGVGDDRRQVDVVDRTGPSRSPPGRSRSRAGPRAAGVSHSSISRSTGRWPRSRCRRRTARRSRGPGRPRPGAPRAWPSSSAWRAADGERLQHLLGRAQGPGRLPQLALDPAPPGERPLGHVDRLALAVGERMLGEPGPDQVDQLAVAQRVAGARGHLEHVGLRRPPDRGRPRPGWRPPPGRRG